MTPRALWRELASGAHELGGSPAHHLADVLRLKAGDRVELFDGAGRSALATLTQVRRGRVGLAVGAVALDPPAPFTLHVVAALPKGGRADWLVEKLTEIGAHRLTWLVTERGPREGVSPSRAQRFQRMSEAAATQCRRNRLPGLDGPLDLGATLSLPAASRVLADRDGARLEALPPPPPDSVAQLFVGPEGGFTDGERLALLDAGARPLRLSPHVLRVETAAVAGAAAILGR